MGDRKSTTNKISANKKKKGKIKISENINSQIFAPGFIKNYRLDNIFINSLNKAKVFLNSVKFFYMHCILR